ncbi:MAG: hypothetical protein RLZZ381_2734, partial [Cyanobacteriota bacterium]
CPAGIPTTGYGRTTGDLKTPTNPDAETQWLYEKLQHINTRINNIVVPKQSPQQMAAMMSLVYNIGERAFASSTLVKTINRRDGEEAITTQWSRWNRAGNMVLPGLIRRRKAEIELYFSR